MSEAKPFGISKVGEVAGEAVGQARQRCWRYDWIVDLDIQGFFDNIPQDLLIRAVKKHAQEQAGWHIEFNSITQPLRSIPFRGLPCYYGWFRPWAPLPYSRPRGSSTCGFSVRIEVPRSAPSPLASLGDLMPDAAP